MEVLECETCGKIVAECICFNDEAHPKATDKQVGGNHYKDKKLQPWDIIDALDLNFYEGNALKYLIRYKEKNGVEDLKKSIHYIEKIIEDVSSTTSSSN
jgi:hypothetical protein